MSFSPQLYRRITAENPIVKPIPLLHTKREMWDGVQKTVRDRMLRWCKRVGRRETGKEGGQDGGHDVVVRGWEG